MVLHCDCGEKNCGHAIRTSSTHTHQRMRVLRSHAQLSERLNVHERPLESFKKLNVIRTCVTQCKCSILSFPIALSFKSSRSFFPYRLAYIYAGPQDDVVDLDASTFESRVLAGDEFWVVEWYADWCGGA